MNTLQQIIEEMKDDFKKATDKAREMSRKEDIHLEALFDGKRSAFLKYIPKLELLLKDESKRPQPPDLANTVLGEVPPVVNGGTEENSKAVEGATPVVRQNEQTKEVNDVLICRHCSQRFTDEYDLEAHVYFHH